MFKIEVGNGMELRLRGLEDAQALFELVDADRLRLGQFLPWVEKTVSVNDTRDYLQRSLDGFEAGTSLSLGIWQDGRWIGSIGLHDITAESRKGEVGYWLCQGFEGRGVMTRSVKALVAYAFRERNLYRITLRCAVANMASVAVAERAGFVREGTLLANEWAHGEPEDQHLYRLLKPEWEVLK